VTARRIAGAVVGLVFGVVLSWSGLTSPEVVRDGLLFRSPYLYEFFVSAVVVATAGQWLVRRARARALLTGEPVQWRPQAPERRHVLGAMIFGLGWGVSGACPGPIATQIGQGIGWGLATMTGVVIGIAAYLRRQAPAPAAPRRPDHSLTET
jgi:uncharacterized protein